MSDEIKLTTISRSRSEWLGTLLMTLSYKLILAKPQATFSIYYITLRDALDEYGF